MPLPSQQWCFCSLSHWTILPPVEKLHSDILLWNFFSSRKQSEVTHSLPLITEKSQSQWWSQIKLESQSSSVRVVEPKMYFGIKAYWQQEWCHFCFLGQRPCIHGLPACPEWNITVLQLFITGTLFAAPKRRSWDSKQLLKSKHWRRIIRIFCLAFSRNH